MSVEGERTKLTTQVIVTAITGLVTAIVAATAAIYGAHTVGKSQIEAAIKAANENYKNTSQIINSSLEVANISRKANAESIENSAKHNLEAIILSSKLQYEQITKIEAERQQAESTSAAKIIIADILSRIKCLRMQPLSGNNTNAIGIATDLASVGGLSFLVKAFLSETRLVFAGTTPDYIYQSLGKLPMECAATATIYYSRITIEKNRLNTSQSDENIQRMIDYFSKGTDSNFTKGGKLSDTELSTAKEIFKLKKELLDIISRSIAEKSFSEILLCESLGYEAIASIHRLIFKDIKQASLYSNLSQESKKQAIDFENKCLNSGKQFADMVKLLDQMGHERYQKNLNDYFNQFLQ